MRAPSPAAVTPAVLADHPLPDHGTTSSKQARGRVVVVGGTAETPGAVLLAGIGALRAGAGTVQVVTAGSAAPPLAIALPEARVVGVDGGLDPSTAEAGERLAGAARPLVERADAVLVGTGTFGSDASGPLLRGVLHALGRGDARLVVDAGALAGLGAAAGFGDGLAGRVVLVPNPGEAADLLDLDPEEVDDDPDGALDRLVQRFGCAVAVRTPDTVVGAPGAGPFVDRSGNTGLATSGSGDVLAGLVVGFLARGADPVTALLWATRAHGEAAERCAARIGGLGYLARELLDEVVPAIGSLHHRGLGPGDGSGRSAGRSRG